MWIIVLDRSESMDEGFSADSNIQTGNRRRETQANSKWEAAKEAVATELKSMKAAERVVVFVFNSRTELIFDGRAGEYKKLADKLEAITPLNGTSISDALTTVYAYTTILQEAHISVTVITDGLDHLKSVQPAAEQLAENVSMIEVILIDPTEEGMAIAEGVVQRGKLIVVTKADSFTREVDKSRQRQQEEEIRINNLLAKIDEEKALINSAVPEKEKLTLTLGYPSSLQRDIWYSMILFLHLPYSIEEVNKRLAQHSKKEHQQFAESKVRLHALRGTWFTIVPIVDDVDFNPRTQEVAWVEDLQEVNFRYKVKNNVHESALQGRMQLLVNGLEVASIGITLTMQGTTWINDNDPWDFSTVSLHQQIFASYAREDARIIEFCKKTYNLMGIQLIVDKLDLLGGQEWHPALKAKISSSDAFMLFWSQKSRASKNVTYEWKHALEVKKSKGVPYFIYPLYWEIPSPSIPTELNHLHFKYFDCEELKRDESPREGAANHTPNSTHTILQTRAVNIKPTVLPFVQGETRKSISEWKRGVANAIAFLENTTGLRYYPLPTLLVDRLVIQNTRRVQQMVDAVGKQDEQSRLSWIEIIKKLLLEFHTRNIPPFIDGEAHPTPEIAMAVEETVLTELNELAEWNFHYWMWRSNHFPGEEEHLLKYNESLPGTFFEKMKVVLEQLLGQSLKSNHLRGMHRIKLSPPKRAFSTKIDETRGWEAIGHLLEDYEITSKQAPKRTIDSNTYELTATGYTWLAVLKVLIDRVALALEIHEPDSYMDQGGNTDWEALGAAVLMDAIANALRLDIMHPFKESITEFLYPSWRRVRDWMVMEQVHGFREDADFAAFLRSYFEIMKKIFHTSMKDFRTLPWIQYYKFESKEWEIINEQYPGAGELNIEKLSAANTPGIVGNFMQFVNLFEEAVNHVLHKSDQQATMLIESALFGAYIPEGNDQADMQLLSWAEQHKIIQQSLLPGAAKVLFCTQPIDHEDETVNKILQQCVLVHEHFHAILATGIGANDVATNPIEWQAAMPLNESLAVWMEWYYLRCHAAQLGDATVIEKVNQAILAYITYGEYPNWPYRGAEKIERIFNEKGLSAVADIIHHFRSQPRNAQEAFDKVKNV